MKSDYVRAEILRVLYAEHPEWCPRALLKKVLEDRQVLITDEQFNSELVYLRDKPEREDGYVEFKVKEVGPDREKFYSFRLTPMGVDLMEGNIPRDQAIAL